MSPFALLLDETADRDLCACASDNYQANVVIITGAHARPPLAGHFLTERAVRWQVPLSDRLSSGLESAPAAGLRLFA